MITFQTSLQNASNKIIVFSIILIGLGILSILSPAFTGAAIAVIIGILFIVAGALRTTFSFITFSWNSAFLRFLFGIVMLIVGIWLIINPNMGMVTLTLILAIMFIVDGVSEISFSSFLKPVGGGGTMLITGILDVLLGLVIWIQWPASGAWAIGVIVGIKLITNGISLLALGIIGKKELKLLGLDE